MTRPTARERELESALLDLTICAAPFAVGRGMKVVRGNLMKSIKNASTALKTEPCQRDYTPSLNELADAADEERKRNPNYRADLEG